MKELSFEIKKILIFTNKGMSNMKQTSIRMTIIHSQKLQNIVGQGGASPYQIWTAPGATVGKLGKIINTSESRAANDQAVSSNRTLGQSWLQRVWLKLGQRQSP